MDLLINLLFVLVVSVVIGAMFSLGLRGRNDWAGTFWFFVILFFGTWALGAWMRPIGPPAWDVFWVPYVVAAAVIALLLAAASPRATSPPRQTIDGETAPADPRGADPRAAGTRRRLGDAIAAIGVYFWLLLAIAIAAIALH